MSHVHVEPKDVVAADSDAEIMMILPQVLVVTSESLVGWMTLIMNFLYIFFLKIIITK